MFYLKMPGSDAKKHAKKHLYFVRKLFSGFLNSIQWFLTTNVEMPQSRVKEYPVVSCCTHWRLEAWDSACFTDIKPKTDSLPPHRTDQSLWCRLTRHDRLPITCPALLWCHCDISKSQSGTAERSTDQYPGKKIKASCCVHYRTANSKKAQAAFLKIFLLALKNTASLKVTT